MTKARRIFFLGLLFPWLAFAQSAPAPTGANPAVPELTHMKDVAKALNAGAFKGKKFSRTIKIAILDNGFDGYEAEVGKSLPNATFYHAGEASAGDTVATPFHGLVMAKLVAGLIKESGVEADYEMHLFKTYGYTKLVSAVEEVIKGEFDIVLYPQVWEYGGNGDGKGFINTVVNKAISAGVLWINSSGNFGHLMKRAPVDGKAEGGDEFVVFKEKGKASDSVTFYCKPLPGSDKCPLGLVAAWNDYRDDRDTGTEKDLDLYLYDSRKKQLACSEKRQKLKIENQETDSITPRELIETTLVPKPDPCALKELLKPGAYKVRVKIKSKNFSPSQDEVRITLTGAGIEMADATTGETLLPPADNPGAIVVGASDYFQTSVSEKLKRPHVYLPSEVRLKNRPTLYSTSSAAALAAGLAVLHLGTGVEKNNDALIAKLKEASKKPVLKPPVVADIPADAVVAPPGRGARKAPVARGDDSDERPRRQRPAQDMDLERLYAFRPYEGEPTPAREPIVTSQPAPGMERCLRRTRLPHMYPAARWILEGGGGEAVFANGGPAILINYNFACYENLCPRPNERIYITPEGPTLIDRRQAAQGLPPGYYPLITREISICRGS